MKCAGCAKALPRALDGFWCTACFKVKYCSTECEVQHSPAHQTLCALVEDLKRRLSGFNHRLFLRDSGSQASSEAFMPSHETYQKLYHFGRTHLTQDQARSAICYTTHRVEKLDEVRQKQARAVTPGEVFVDPHHELVIHCFVAHRAHLKSMLKGLPSAQRLLFFSLCERPGLVTELGVPVLYFRDLWVAGEHDVRIALFLVTPSEF